MPAPAGSHYAVLELEPCASADDVRKAHRRLALKWHPDKVADPADEVAVRVATQQFQLLQAAYEVLSDPDRRRQYDARSGWAAPARAPSGTSSRPAREPPPWKRPRDRPAAGAAAPGGEAGGGRAPEGAGWAHGDKAELRVPGDVPTIAAAVDALPVSGGTIRVDAGTYPGLVVISKPWVKIVGIGDVTVAGQVVFRYCAAGSRLEGLRIRASCPGGAVDFKSVTGDIVLEGCEVSNDASAGIVFEGCYGKTEITRCVVRDCKYDGLGMHMLKGKSTHKGSVVVADSRFEGNGYDGLYLGDPRFRVSLVRTHVTGNKRHGVFVRGTELEMTDSTVEANGQADVHREAFGQGQGQGRAAAPRARAPQAREVDSASSLPEGWRAFRTAEGLTYYYHSSTGTTQWSNPAQTDAATSGDPAALADSAEPMDADDDGSLLDGWVAILDDSTGHAYYHHAASGVTQWEHPGSSCTDDAAGTRS